MYTVKHVIRALMAVCLLGALAYAQQNTTSAQRPARRKKKVQDVSVQLSEVQKSLEAQQQQIQQLTQAVHSRDAVIQQLQEKVNGVETNTAQAQQKTDAAVSEAEQEKQDVAKVRDDVSDLKTNATNSAVALQETEKRVNDLESPIAIHFKGITITPGGFLEAAGMYRTHNENADVGSTYGNIPFDGTANSHLSEFRGSARQSRLSLLAEGKVGATKLSGYYEMDFLGAAPTANEVESDSFNMRQRQLWGQAEFKNGISVLGGQAWSLLTTDRKGITPRQELVPLTIDAQYVVGYNWARQWGIRVTKDWNDHVWAAFAVENPETNLNVINPPAGVFGFNNSPNATSPSSLLTLNNTPGANGVSTDLAPDLVGKLAFEPGWGHFEIKALGRFFRDRINGGNNYTEGGGLGFGAILPLTKKVDFIAEGLAGNGIGRYASGAGPDVTLRPDGSIVPLRTYQTMVGIEAHPVSKLDLYLYGGNEYYGRAAYINSAGKPVGYGSPLNDLSGCSVEIPAAGQGCQAQTKSLWQVQPGFWYRLYKGQMGTAQIGASYSYTYRNAWAGVGTTQPKGIENIVMTSFRYYLP